MAFRLDPRRAFASQVRALLLEQCARALAATRRTGPEAVHDLRRCGKRSRALLRLARPGLRRRVFRRLNHAWRDLGRRLSGMRDQAVLARSFERLARRYADVLAPAALQRIRQRLSPHVAPSKSIRRSLRKILHRLHDEVKRAELPARWRDAARGHARCQAECLAAQRRATHRGHAEDRHAWRKRAKDLGLQMHLLAPLWPGFSSGWSDLAEHLGQERDLMLLQRWLTQADDMNGVTRVRREVHRWQRHLRTMNDHLARDLPDDPDLTRRLVLHARQAVA